MGASPPAPRVILAGEPVPPSRAVALHAAGVGEVVNARGPAGDTTHSTLAWIPCGGRVAAFASRIDGLAPEARASRSGRRGGRAL